MLQQAIQQRDEYKDKLQREEVITAQLASENESIAEYVTLYQQQRLVRANRFSFSLLTFLSWHPDASNFAIRAVSSLVPLSVFCFSMVHFPLVTFFLSRL